MESPDRLQEYDGFDASDDDGVPQVVLKHMRAMVEKDAMLKTCQFSEVVDMDKIIEIPGDEKLGIPDEKKFKTVRAAER